MCVCVCVLLFSDSGGGMGGATCEKTRRDETRRDGEIETKERKQKVSRAKSKNPTLYPILLATPSRCMQETRQQKARSARPPPLVFSWLFLCRVLIYCECARTRGQWGNDQSQVLFSLAWQLSILGGRPVGLIKSERRFAWRARG